MTSHTTPLLSIVVPMFNEQAILERSVNAIVERFDMANSELILVDDGSTDATFAIAAALLHPIPRAELVKLDSNVGKGAALRAGVARTSGSAVLFMDADLSTSLDDADRLVASLATHDVAIGSRAVAGAIVERSDALRVAMGRSFNWLMRRVTGLPIADSQCGCKAFRGDVGRQVFALARTNGFAIDPEVLRLARLLGYTIVEQPVSWRAGAESKVRPLRDSLGTGFDLFAVRWATRRAAVARETQGRRAASDAGPAVPVRVDVEMPST